jgi:hypothetical protein
MIIRVKSSPAVTRTQIERFKKTGRRISSYAKEEFYLSKEQVSFHLHI